MVQAQPTAEPGRTASFRGDSLMEAGALLNDRLQDLKETYD